MGYRVLLIISLLISAFTLSKLSHAGLITFDDPYVVDGFTSYGYDEDSDNVYEAIFSTTDTRGFTKEGPDNMSFINTPGIEGRTSNSTELRVDFIIGAITSLSFGFATNNRVDNEDGVLFSVFDSTDTLLASVNQLTVITKPEIGQIIPEANPTVTFAGIASYAVFDFSNEFADKYIIDNFNVTFGTSEVAHTPEPSTIVLIGIGVIGIAGVTARRKWKKKVSDKS